MNTLRAIYASFIHQQKETTTDLSYFTLLLGQVLMVIVIGWTASQSTNPSVLAYMLVGVPLMPIAESVTHRIGWTLTSELWDRTLEFTMISRTPMILVMLGKSISLILYGIPSGIIAFVTIYIMTGSLPSVSNIILVLISVCFVIIGIAIFGLLISPLMVLVGGRGGFFDAIIPFGAVLSGYLFPIDRLPSSLQAIAHLLPTSWGMVSVWRSINGESIWMIISAWAAFLATSILLLAITYFMYKIVEKRVRITGVLSTY
jgi:ABC-type polysaccharide/polyol phosphate export permease